MPLVGVPLKASFLLAVAAAYAAEARQCDSPVDAVALDSEAGGEVGACLLQRESGVRHAGGASGVQAHATGKQADAEEVASKERARPRAAAPLSAGVTEGMGIDYAAQSHSLISVATVFKGAAEHGATATAIAPPTKNKVVLMLIEMCPLCWVLGIDRFYLGHIGLAITKLAVSLLTFSIGGLIWGLVDFIIIMLNALQREEAIDSLGMSAKFDAAEVPAAFALAFVDILMVPCCIGLARFIWWWRKQQRMERLKEAAMKSPNYGIQPSQMKD